MTISGYSTDPNLGLVIDDVRALRAELQGGPDEATAKHLAQLAAGYLTVNRPIVDLAFEAWRQTSEEELRRMFAQDRALDENATRHGFETIGGDVFQLAPDILRGAEVNLLSVEEDDLNMLLRVLDYALYLADCSSETVHWHPVLSVNVALVDRLRESLPPA